MPTKSIPQAQPPPEVGEIPIYRNGSTPEASHLEPVDMALLREGISDEGNARCVNLLYAGRFLHVDALGWLRYTGTHWTTKQAEAHVSRAIVDTLTRRIKAALSQDAEKHDKLIKFCIPNKNRVTGALYLLESLVSADVDEFDAQPDFLNCKNGVLDLRTATLSPHDPSQRFTHCTSVKYNDNANATPLIQWLTGAMSHGADTVRWLQLALGYTLTGHTREEVLFYLYGPPRSGKGTLTEMLLALMGAPLAKEVNFGTFTAQRSGDSQNFDLAPLKPCRAVLASESNAYERFNEAKIKMLTGGNEVYCAFKHQTHFGYRPQYKIWLSSNQPVNADPDDDAVWGRLRVVEFPHSHLGSEDKTLKQRMKSPAMLEGLLAWAVEGARQWYALGSKGLPELEHSAQLKAQQRSELDHVQAWLDECCEISEHHQAASKEFYPSYRLWCEVNGVESKKQKGLALALTHKGFKPYRTNQQRGFAGLRIVD
jgi:putative DNA primase/helicase